MKMSNVALALSGVVFGGVLLSSQRILLQKVV